MANKIGRLRKPVLSILVDVDGELIAYTDGHLSGSRKTINTIKLNSKLKLPINISYAGPEINSDLNAKPENILAAIMSAYPERSRILEAPKEVLSLLPFEDEEGN